MKVLAMEREVPGKRAEEFAPHLRMEAEAVWDLYQSGAIRELHFRQDRREAVLVMECECADQAGELLSALPLVKQGFIEFDIIPLVPYSGFARLFG